MFKISDKLIDKIAVFIFKIICTLLFLTSCFNVYIVVDIGLNHYNEGAPLSYWLMYSSMVSFISVLLICMFFFVVKLWRTDI